MLRTVALITYLVATVVVVLLFNADSANHQEAMALWAVASALLGLASGKPSWCFLAFLAIPFAVPFGTANEFLGSDGPIVAVVVFVWSIGSALLIAAAATLRMVFDDRRRESVVH